ncbi:MAG: hypothetical protein SGCHY_004344 [Lobulomycetales sp.]
MPPPLVRKIAVLGSRAVGKSSLSVQFVDNTFSDTYYPTIEHTYTKIIKFRGNEFAIEIVDTAGQDEYSIFNSKHAIGIHGYILVYSLTSRASFTLIKHIRDKILNYTGLDWVPLVIVGNKSDLADRERQVEKGEGQKLAEAWKCVYIEASAKLNQSVTRVFELLLQEIERTSDGTGGAGGAPASRSGGDGCTIF